jgi:hypothetical protein
MPVCQLCRKKFKIISSTHLKSAHNTNIQQYGKKFGFKGVGFKKTVAQLPKDDPKYLKWRESLLRRAAPWNKGQTKETHKGIAKISRTFKRKKIDNFKEWRRKAREEGRIPFIYPSLLKNTELAFLTGLILGDGHLERFPRTELLQVTLGTDKPLLWQYTAKIIQNTFHKEPNIHKRKSSNCLDIKLYQKSLSERLEIPLGNRGKVAIQLPEWICENDSYLIACLKGLFEAEGSLSIHKPTYTYNFQFSNQNVNLLNEVENALIKLGFHPERRINAARLRKKKEVFKFKKLITFRKYARDIAHL